MLVIGNGESRKDLNISKYTQTKVGCNAVYRDFHIDHLICCDRRMVLEAQQNNYDGIIYTRHDWVAQFTPAKVVPELPYCRGKTRLDDPWHWGSGPYAVLLGTIIASKWSEKPEIHMIGFDLDTGLYNNIYKGTENYNDADSSPVDPSYWIYQIDKVFENFPEANFTYYNNKPWPTEQKNVCNKMVIEFGIDNETT